MSGNYKILKNSPVDEYGLKTKDIIVSFSINLNLLKNLKKLIQFL